MKNRITKVLVITLAVVAMVSSRSALAQTFKKVNVQNKARMAQIASGGMSVWGLGTNGHPYISRGGSFVQASTISLTQIAVGGGNLRQPDAVWAIDSAYNIYEVVKSGTTYLFNQIPGSLDFIAVGIGYQDACHPYEVWGLNQFAEIWRYDFCAKNWSQIPGSLGWMIVSGGDVWGVNGINQLYRFDYTSLTFKFVHLISEAGVPFAVGPGSVWALMLPSFPGEPTYVNQILPLTGLNAEGFYPAVTQIQAGGDGVWGIDASGQVFVLHYADSIFVQIPGIVLSSISVGSGGGVWGIDPTGQVFAFSTP